MNEAPPTVSHTRPQVHLWWLTALLICINAGLFLWQIFHGVDATQPSTKDAIFWGADYAPLTFLEEPSRLLSSMFFHFGFIHLMLNMWALYIFGSISEQMFGRFYFITLYFFAGLMGSLLSGVISIQDSLELIRLNELNPDLLPGVSAGASGAVMGLGAALTLISIFPVSHTQKFVLDKKSLLFVMGINLVMGFSISGINNAAHIGGMLMGLVFAAVWYGFQKSSRTFFAWIIATLVAACITYFTYQYCLSQLDTLAPLWIELVQMMKIHVLGNPT